MYVCMCMHPRLRTCVYMTREHTCAWMHMCVKMLTNIKKRLHESSTLNSQPVVIHSSPSPLKPQPLTLQPQPLTLTLNHSPSPSTLNHQPSTFNPQPSTLNPSPSTLNPLTLTQDWVTVTIAEAFPPLAVELTQQWKEKCKQ